MKFTASSLAALALAGSAAASAPQHSGPYTISHQNLAAAQSSVLSVLAAQKPKPTTLASVSSHAETKPATTITAKTSSHTNTWHTQVRTTTMSSHQAESLKPTTTTPHATATATQAKHGRRGLLSDILGLITNIPIPSQACVSMPSWGFDFLPSVNTPAGFLNDTTIYTTALNAAAPAGYVWNWAGLFSSVVSPYYIGYAQLTSYNVSACAAYCTATTGCQGFDIYYERDPTVWPGVGCMNPSTQTGVHCALYSTKLNYTNALNVGQWNGNFMVVIAGANGYSKINATSTPATTAVTTTSAVANNFTIVSAYFADQNITALAQQNFLVNGQLVINTTFPNAGLGSDPWPANSAKTISILYIYNGEYRVFSAVQNTGVYTQPAASYSVTSAPGASLLANFLPTNGAGFTIVAVTYGGVQVSSSPVYIALYAALFTGLPFVVSDFNLGFTSTTTTSSTKTLVVWYKTSASSNILTLTGRQATTLTISI